MDADGWLPVPPTGRSTVFDLPRFWYAACFSDDLRARRPIARVVHGAPLVLFRGPGGRAVAALDRCPHRNVPLSLGRCVDGTLRCAYHGWRFDGDGRCVEVPGLATAPDDVTARRVDTFPVRECDGVIWVVPSQASPAAEQPVRLPHAADPRYTTIRRHATVDGPVVAAVENALDVPHTGFLHRGLFRGRSEPVAIEAVVRHGDGTVEAEYLGEPVPPGVIARILAPEGGVVEHIDRFIAPSISQVEYRLGPSHLVITTAFTPIDRERTALHATVSFSSRLPGSVVARLVTPLAGRILAQDARILAQQQRNVRRFGGERFANTPIDVLGTHIVRMLRRAERGEVLSPATAAEERVTLYA